MATVLVTGGAGYVGSHCCKALAAAGHTPVVFDNLINGYKWAVKWGPLEVGDILDRGRLDAVINQYKPDAVMHFAALAEVGESVGKPEIYYQNNILGTLTLLEAMRHADINKIVFSSTCAIYGEPERSPMDETLPMAPISPYGFTKLACERLMEDFEVAHGLKSARLRYFNAAGADPDGEIGEAHQPESHLIPIVLEVALGQREAIKIFGNDYPTPDGTALRDYIHVVDLASAHLAALDRLLGGGSSLAANLGTGTGFSVREVVEMGRVVSGRDIRADDAPRRAGDPPTLVADPALAKAELGWTATRSGLKVVIEDAWRWHCSQAGQHLNN